MIKRYNEFVDSKTNEEFVDAPEMGAPAPAAPARETETPTRTTPTPTERPRPTRPTVVPDKRPSEEDAPLAELEQEDEQEDYFYSKLKEVALALGLDENAIVDNKVEYEGKEIIFPSETEKYHVDRKKFDTAQQVVDYLQGRSAERQVPKLEDDRIDPEFEAKSYKYSRKHRLR